MSFVSEKASSGMKSASESPEKDLPTPNKPTSTGSMNNSRSGSLNGSINGKSFLSTEMSMALKRVSSQQMLENGHGAGSSDAEEEFDGLLSKDPNHSLNTLQMLHVLRKNRQLCDLILQLDDDSQDIYCHQVILACNSKFFMEIFNNYELEEKSSRKKRAMEASDSADKPAPDSDPKKQSLRSLVNKNHNSSQRQLLFCLSDYLRDYLSDSYHHHYAKMNSVVNHNSHFHHHHPHGNNLIDGTATAATNLHHHGHHDETVQHFNHTLDYEALKICVDYMYTSQLRVPSYLLPHVYTLAYHLSFDNIVQLCAQYLTKNLSVDNCLGIRSFALDENLIQASTQCIEKNIEYILQLGPVSNLRSVSSSLSSSLSNCSAKTGEADLTAMPSPTLSSSLNLANKEFNHLPRINIELVGLGAAHKYKLPDSIVALTDLCMNWLVQALEEKPAGNCSGAESAGVESNGSTTAAPHQTLGSLCDNLNLLYMNGDDHTLHDCADMDSTDRNFSDYIDDYQKHHTWCDNRPNSLNGSATAGLTGSRHSPPSRHPVGKSPSPCPSSSSRLKTFKITDQELNAIGTATPIKLKVLHDNEVICTHQTSESSFITICTLTAKLVTLSVHLLSAGTGANPSTSSTHEPVSDSTPLVSPIDTESQFSLDQHNNAPQSLGTPVLPGPSFNRSLSSNSSIDSEKLPKMTVARCSHGVIACQNRLYIIGGYDRGECLDVCECYDPATNQIARIEPMESRRGRAAITWSKRLNTLLVMGGSDGHTDLNSIECYDLTTRRWSTTKFDFELECSNLGAIACTDFIYLVGLKGDGGKSLSRTSCLRFEPSTKTFTRLAELNNGRSQSALVFVPSSSSSSSSSDAAETLPDEKALLYVFGGHDQIRCLNSCEVYNMQEKKWTLIASMHEPRRGCGAAYHKESQSIFIVGGTNGSNSLRSVEVFNTVTKKWSAGPELNVARTNVAIAFIGNVLFAVGGFDGKSFLRTIEYLNCKSLNNGWSMYHKQSDFESVAH